MVPQRLVCKSAQARALMSKWYYCTKMKADFVGHDIFNYFLLIINVVFSNNRAK